MTPGPLGAVRSQIVRELVQEIGLAAIGGESDVDRAGDLRVPARSHVGIVSSRIVHVHGGEDHLVAVRVGNQVRRQIDMAHSRLRRRVRRIGVLVDRIVLRGQPDLLTAGGGGNLGQVASRREVAALGNVEGGGQRAALARPGCEHLDARGELGVGSGEVDARDEGMLTRGEEMRHPGGLAVLGPRDPRGRPIGGLEDVRDAARDDVDDRDARGAVKCDKRSGLIAGDCGRVRTAPPGKIDLIKHGAVGAVEDDHTVGVVTRNPDLGAILRDREAARSVGSSGIGQRNLEHGVIGRVDARDGVVVFIRDPDPTAVRGDLNRAALEKARSVGPRRLGVTKEQNCENEEADPPSERRHRLRPPLAKRQCPRGGRDPSLMKEEMAALGSQIHATRASTTSG